jgi:hypothetical protein
MYTCRQIAHEMQGLALRTHTITFTTLSSDDLSRRAGRWHLLATEEKRIREGGVVMQAVTRMSDAMAEVIRTRLRGRDFAPFFDHIRGPRPRELGLSALYASMCACGEIPSTQRDIVRDMLQLAITEPSLHEHFATTFWQTRGSGNYFVPKTRYQPSLIFDSDKEPWKIPTEEELDRLSAELPLRVARNEDTRDPEVLRSREFWQSSEQVFCFSAAAAAIHFLTIVAVSPSVRQHIRRVVVHEDRCSVVHPECHAQGLIPFCQENPDLRIERRASLWRTVICPRVPVMHRIPLAPRYGSGGFKQWGLTARVSSWMSEASSSALPAAITSVIDAGPIPQRATEILQNVIHRDVGWRLAYERLCVPGAATPDHVVQIKTEFFYHQTIFPDVLQALCENRPGSRVQCNFDPGVPWDENRISDLMERGRAFPPVPFSNTYLSWGGHLGKLMEQSEQYDTVPPLPPLADIIEETLNRRPQAAQS